MNHPSAAPESALPKFVFLQRTEIQAANEPVHVVINLSGQRYTLGHREFLLASLLDGERTAGQVIGQFQIQQNIVLEGSALDAFIRQLGSYGLLKWPAPKTTSAGRQAPSALPAEAGEFRRRRRPLRLPPPPTEDPVVEAEVLDESSDSMELAERRPAPQDFPRHDAPRWARPALAGRPRRGQRRRPWFRIPVGRVLPIGRVFNFANDSAPALWLLAVLSLLVLFGLAVNYLDVVRDAARLRAPLTLFQTVLFSLLTVNLISQAARAAAIHKYTGALPEFGITLVLNLIPRFATRPGNVRRAPSAEEFSRMGRAGLTALVTLLVIGGLGWLAARRSGSWWSLMLLLLTLSSVLQLLMRLNPLARREGYRLLSGWLGMPRLREQAMAVFLGRWIRRPAGMGEAPAPHWALWWYGAAVIAYMLALIGVVFGTAFVLLEARWGGFGVGLVAVLAAVALWAPVRNLARAPFWKAATDRVGPADPGVRARRSVIATGMVLVALVPYTYEASGEFRVLPGQRAEVKSLVTGEVREIYVKEGDQVQKGQALALIANDEELAQKQAAQATLEKLQADLRLAESGAKPEEIDLARQRVRTAQARFDASSTEAKRLKEGYRLGAATQQDYERAQGQADVDQAALAEADASLKLVESGSRLEELEARRADVDKARSQLDYNQKRLTYAQVVAGISGQVVSGTLQFAVGDYLKEGESLLTLEDRGKVTVEIQVPEVDIDQVQPGTTVRLKAWGFPDRTFEGVVTTIAPNAEDSEYGKIIRVATEIVNAEGLLRSEMTGYAKVRGEEFPLILAFSRMIVRFVRVEFWSWIP